MTEAEVNLIRRERDELFAASYRAAVAFRMKCAHGQAIALRGLTSLVDSISDRDVSGLRQVDIEETIAAGEAA